VPFGTVEDAVVIMERDDPGRSRGFGFVTYTPARPGAVD
jgi:RNA recognition motif-containing protein